jgi:uncharacterized protein YqjF (DUF2071 family)
MENTKQRLFLTAEWRNLAMLNYVVNPDLLYGLVPAGTDLDCWNGKTFVSLVGFRFLHTRILGMRLPFHCNFDEVNLRFYVKRLVGKEWRRGVVFIREVVPRWAIAAVANAVYNEKYVALPMSHNIDHHEVGLDVEYQWRSRGKANRLKICVKGEAQVPPPESEAHFITEHFWGYTAQRNGSCMEYQVEHPSWSVWDASIAGFEGDVTEFYGAEFAAVLQRKPDSAFLAAGSFVAVYRGQRI